MNFEWKKAERSLDDKEKQAEGEAHVGYDAARLVQQVALPHQDAPRWPRIKTRRRRAERASGLEESLADFSPVRAAEAALSGPLGSQSWAPPHLVSLSRLKIGR